MTTQELLKWVDEHYDNVFSATQKINYMNMAIKDLSDYFGTIVEDATLVTVAAQDSYTYPTGLTDISEIESLAVANQATPSSRYDYTKYAMSKGEDDPMRYNSFFQIVNNLGAKKLVLYPAPSTAGLAIRIRYRKALTLLSPTDLDFEPEFPSLYHEMLAIFCVAMICKATASPDGTQADMHMQMYDSALEALWRKKGEEELAQDKTYRDNKHWHPRRVFGAGF